MSADDPGLNQPGAVGATASTDASAAPQPAPASSSASAVPDSASTAPAASTGPKVLGTMSQEEYEAQLARQQNSATAAQQAYDQTTMQSGAATATVQPMDSGQTAAVDTSVLPGATPDEQYQYAFGLLRQNKYDDAEHALRAFIEQNPEHQLTGNATYWLGETYYVRGDYQNAAVTFAQGVKHYPQSGKAPDNMMKLGMALAALGKGNEACLAFAEVGKRYPQASEGLKDRVVKEQQRNSCQ
jgi:tol-pal system protein YbgF